MLHYNTSMKVAEESFSIGSYVYMYYDGGDQAVFDIFSFWIMLPKGKCDYYKYGALW